MIRRIYFIFIFIVSFSIQHTYAQIEAVTTNGKKVILFEDGSWEYLRKTEILNSNDVEIDTLLSKRGELTELYYMVSPRLDRYFSGSQSMIRGKVECSFIKGEGRLFFQWEVNLSDAYRYFGNLRKGVELTLNIKGTDDLHLNLNQDLATDIMEKYNYSVLKGACILSQQQLNVLLKNQVVSIDVAWKKKNEKYLIADSDFFRNEFSTLISKSSD